MLLCLPWQSRWPSGEESASTAAETGVGPRFTIASLAEWLRRPPRERKIPGSNPACAGIFSGSSHTSDLKKWHSSGYPARRLAL